MSELQWPPRREDLEELYVRQRLSAAKIAERYGLRYASPKTAESTILYHLKRAGIARRDAAEHIRTVTPEMVDEWVRRYGAGESLKDISGSLVSPATVFNHLRRRGVELRDKVDAQIVKVTKFQKSAFNGEEAERMYLIGFVWGDCSVELHGRAIRVRSSTTRPGFAQLFDDLFGRYGHVRMYPKRAQLVEAEWSVEVDLDRSFEFLLRKNLHELPRVPDDKECRLNFLAGLVDAEGAICWHLKSSPGFELQISNTSEDLLKIAKDCLVGQGYHPKLTRSKQKPGRLPTAVEGTLLRLVLYRQEEVSKMVCEFPVKHSEKKRKADVARAYFRSAELDSSNFPTGWIELKRELAVARSKFVQDAVSELAQKQLGITTR